MEALMVELIKDDQFAVLEDFDNRAKRERMKANRRSARSLPIIDFTAYARDGTLAARQQIARELRKACLDTGFFYLVNHGISQSEFDVAHAFGHMFFELPVDVKATMEKGKHPAKQGWMAVGGVYPRANTDDDADQKETFNCPREMLPGEIPGENPQVANGQWPAPALVPGFREFVAAHVMKRVAVAQKLVRALSLSLDLPEDFLDAAHKYPATGLTYNYYPALDPERVGRTQWGISPHTDYGTCTLLSQDSVGGLEVKAGDSEWIDAPPLPGAFVVNLGDLFSRWTNGVYKSTLHRASNFNPSGRARVSLPLFFNPHPKALVECMPTCQGPGNPPKYEPVEAGPYVRALVAQSEITGRPGVAKRTVDDRLKSL
jgi:isopenicillin N synthase-like dioxygenase